FPCLTRIRAYIPAGKAPVRILPKLNAPFQCAQRVPALLWGALRTEGGKRSDRGYIIPVPERIVMADPDSIKNIARQRASQLKLAYNGALLPQEALALMQAGAKLVDVRTKAELEWVGRVPGAVAVEWSTWPGGRPNPDFVPQLEAQVAKNLPVMFL